MNIATENKSTLPNDELVERILGFNNNFLIRDLFEIMNEVLANRNLSTYKHTLRVAQIAKAVGTELLLSEEAASHKVFWYRMQNLAKPQPHDKLLRSRKLNNP